MRILAAVILFIFQSVFCSANSICEITNTCSNCTIKVMMPEPWCHSFNYSSGEMDGYDYALSFTNKNEEFDNATVLSVTTGECSPPGVCLVKFTYDDGQEESFSVPVNERKAKESIFFKND